MTTTGYYNYDGVWLAVSGAPIKTVWGSGTTTLVAGAGAEELYGSNKGETLIGGTGDDTFVIGSLKDTVVAGTSGVDTVIATTVSYVLPSGVQNLILNGTWEPVVGVGNASANIITADRAGESLMGAGGDDVLVSAGGDYFLFQPGSGKDVIVGFHAGATNTDIVRLTGFNFTTFAQVQAAMTQVGSDVVLKLSSTDLIDFKNTTIGNFTAANFQLAANVSGKVMTFDDEFNSFSPWNPTTKTGVWMTSYGWSAVTSLNAHTLLGSGELDIDVDPTFAGTGTKALGINPFSISNGVLSITAAPTYIADKPLLWNYAYTSGVITTQKSFSQTYGYFEMKAEFPSTPVGMWPAFWLLPADGKGDNEIDVFESVNDAPNTVHETVHWDNAAGAASYISFPTYVPNLLTGFHTYGLMWTATTITWFIDGAAVGSVATPLGMNKAMYMVANLSVGGNWPGAPNSTTKFPATYQIDYIHAYSLATNNAVNLAGGTGGDTYYVNNSADTISVAAGTLNESVIASVSYALPANIQNITVNGSGLTATGNSMSNHLTSTGGANTLIGGLGDDTYYVNNVGDKVVELAGQGTDTIISTVSYALPANVETLTVKGAGLTATANGAGDSLTSLGGANTLVGGAGVDTFYVNNVGDKVVSLSGQGADVIVSSVSFSMPDNVHVLRLAGAGLTATGNAAGGDYMTSVNGGDTLIGGAGGNDVFTVSHSNDVIVVAAGTPNETVVAYSSFTLSANVQNLIGKAAGATLVGNTMDNVITAIKGSDTLTGGGGADTFVVTPGNKLETITDFGAGGAHDQIDITAYLKAGLTETFVDHGTYASIDFSNGDVVDLTGGHASSLYLSGHDIL
ncbi:MAG TPA: family 16 glycosylhydrolase [Caulobacteraceae bacterium]|jgi:beta-glucanase (GH16 family)